MPSDEPRPPRGCRSFIGIDFRTEARHADCASQRVSLSVWGDEAGTAGLKDFQVLVLANSESSLESSVTLSYCGLLANASKGTGEALRS